MHRVLLLGLRRSTSLTCAWPTPTPVLPPTTTQTAVTSLQKLQFRVGAAPPFSPYCWVPIKLLRRSMRLTFRSLNQLHNFVRFSKGHWSWICYTMASIDEHKKVSLFAQGQHCPRRPNCRPMSVFVLPGANKKKVAVSSKEFLTRCMASKPLLHRS